MWNRTKLVMIAAALVLGLLAVGGTVSAMARQSGWMGNASDRYEVVDGQSGYQGMMNTQPGYQDTVGTPSEYQGMMNTQPGYQDTVGTPSEYQGMMGGYQQNAGTQVAAGRGMMNVSIKNFAYQSANMRIPVGTTLTWTNRDSVPHSITFMNGMKDSGLLAPGQSFSDTFTTAGTYQYYCTAHPSMMATVTVVS